MIEFPKADSSSTVGINPHWITRVEPRTRNYGSVIYYAVGDVEKYVEVAWDKSVVIERIREANHGR